LNARQLAFLFDRLHHITSFRDSATEVSIECNPESLDREKAAVLVDLGVRRLSIGFQSLESKTLRLFGRVHNAQQAFRAYEAARSAGPSSINIDMIYAAPGHDPDNWGAALTRILELQPEHLSAYNLAFERETVFSSMLEDGSIAPLSEDLELELFAITRERAAAYGLRHYEVSNYARPGNECRHNQGYWENGPYTGLGPSAVSHIEGRRSGNARDVSQYLQRVNCGQSAESWSERLAPRAKLGETWWLGLRTVRGVAPSEARRTADWKELGDPAVTTADRFVAQGFLETCEGRYRLSKAGLPLVDAISSEFLEPQRSENTPPLSTGGGVE
jgi:oxygen-independent coproporphyrinogen III oxidase